MLISERACQGRNENGEPCRQAPLLDSPFCFWHDPNHAQEAAEARRLGGLRRRKEKITSGAYDLEGLASVKSIRRLLEIAAVDTLGLDNSVARSHALAHLAQVALKALENGELEERLSNLEAALKEAPQTHDSPFDLDEEGGLGMQIRK